MNQTTEARLGTWSLAALWFGAAISLAEIWSGGLLAPLGLGAGQLANVAGHLLGGVIFLGAAWISAKERQNAMAVLARPFGPAGPRVFGVLNILQLVGWTAVMLITGASALQTALAAWNVPHADAVGKVILGILLLGWVWAGWRGVKSINLAAVVLLLVLTLIVTALLIVHPQQAAQAGAPITFPLGTELVLSLPISWLPLIGDYTARAKNPRSGSWASTLGYAAGSLWMFSTGLVGALKTGNPDPTSLMVAAGLGAVGVVVILLSTVTTAFLDVYSAGISATALSPRWKEKPLAVIFAVLGIVLAMIFPMDQYETFLYVIGAVFCPLYAIVMTDRFLFRRSSEHAGVRVGAFIAWALGTALYEVFLVVQSPIGMTIPSALAAALIYALVRRWLEKGTRRDA